MKNLKKVSVFAYALSHAAPHTCLLGLHSHSGDSYPRSRAASVSVKCLSELDKHFTEAEAARLVG